MTSLDVIRDAAARIDASLNELEHGERWIAVDQLLDLRDELVGYCTEASDG